jgi:hypothetical protein
MQTYTANDATVILGQGRKVQYFATIADQTSGPVIVDSYTTNRELKDIPDEINLFGGVAAGQCILKVAKVNAGNLSPYANTSPSAKIRTAISVSVKITNSAGLGDTTFTIFTGVVSVVKIDAVGETLITCLDSSSLLAGLFNLQPGVSYCNIVNPPNANIPALDMDYSPLTIVDQPWLTTGQRNAYCIFSCSGFGGHLPDIGYISPWTSVASSKRIPGLYANEIITSDQVGFIYSKDVTSVTNHQLFQLEMWVSPFTDGTSNNVLTCNAPFVLFVNSTDGSCSTQSSSVSLASVVLVPKLNVGQWNYVRFTQSCTNGFVTMSVTINNTTTVVDNGTQVLSANFFSQNSLTLVSYPATPVGYEGIEVTYVPTGAVFSAPAYRYLQPAGAPNTGITLTTARIRTVSAQVGLNQWQTIQEVAAAEGALAYFDELGVFRYEPRSIFQARKANAVVAKYADVDRLQNIDMTVTQGNLFGRVQATYKPSTLKQVQLGSGNAATYTAIDQPTFTFNSGYSTIQVQCPGKFITPLLAAHAGYVGDWTINQPPALVSAAGGYAVVQASRVGDPAAPYLTNVLAWAFPSATGFTLTVYNPNGFPVSFYTKGFAAQNDGISGDPVIPAVPAGPYFLIAGFAIIDGPLVVITQNANPIIPDTLPLLDNPFRQFRQNLQELVSGVAGDAYVPIPVFEKLVVPGDPRVQLGDAVSIFATGFTAAPIPCLVVGVDHNADPNSAYIMSLNLRPIGPPIGWLLGIPGRSELGSTATFVQY